MRSVGLYKNNTRVAVFSDSAIKELSMTRNADITADTVPIDDMRVVVYSETAIPATEIVWLTDTETGVSGRYLVSQINDIGNNLYEIVSYSLVYTLDSVELPAKYYGGVTLETALEDLVVGNMTFYCAENLGQETITGFCDKQSARQRLQQFCWAVGAYASCTSATQIEILPISSNVEAIYSRSDIYEYPSITNDDEVSKVNLTVHSYTAGGGDGDVVTDGDGNKYTHTTTVLTKENPKVTGALNKELNIDTATLINSTNAQQTLNRVALLFFNSATWTGKTLYKDVTAGQRVSVQDRNGKAYKGYIYGISYSFGKGVATTLEIKQTASGIELSAPLNLRLAADQTSLDASNRGYYSIMWDAVSNATKYVIEKKPSGQGWQEVRETTTTQGIITNPLDEYSPKIKYRVKAVDTTGEYGDSPYSEELEVTYRKVTSAFKNAGHFNRQTAVPDGYSFVDEITPDSGYKLVYDDWDLLIGGVSSKNYGTLESSNKLTISIPSVTADISIVANAKKGEAEKLDTPVVTIVGSVISWATIAHATGYLISNGAGLERAVSMTQFDLSTWDALPVGNNYIYVKATSAVPDYSDSTYSEPVSWNKPAKLSAPVAKVLGATLSWNEIVGAEKYRIVYRDTNDLPLRSFELSMAYNSMTIDVGTAGRYTATVQAIAGTGYSDSDESNKAPFAVVASKLTAPNISWHSSYLAWNAVDGANGYRITIKKGSTYWTTFETTDTQYTVDTSLFTDVGDYYATAIALGCPETMNSGDSNSVKIYTVSATKLSTPVVAVSGTVLSWANIANNSGYIVQVTGAANPLNLPKDTTTFDAKGVGVGTWTMTVTAKGEGNYANSDPSAAVTVTVTATKLPVPTNVKTSGNKTYGNEGELSWDLALPNYGYIVYTKKNGTTIATDTTMENFAIYTIPVLDVGTYTFTVKTHGEGDYADSDESSPVTYIVSKAKLATPTNVAISGKVLSWDNVSGNNGYTIAITGAESKTVEIAKNTTSYTLDLGNGTYSITVTAKGDSNHEASEASSAVSYVVAGGKLPAPTNVKTGGNKPYGTAGMLTWDNVANNSGYTIYARKGSSEVSWDEAKDVTTTSITGLEVGTWSMTVKALGTGDFENSDESAAVSFVVSKAKLATPTGVKITGTTLSWNNVANNSGYTITISGAASSTASVGANVTTYTLSLSAVGTYSITVTAKGTGNYSDSNASAAVSYTVESNAPTIPVWRYDYIASMIYIANDANFASYKLRMYSAESGGTAIATQAITKNGNNPQISAGTYTFSEYPYETAFGGLGTDNWLWHVTMTADEFDIMSKAEGKLNFTSNGEDFVGIAIGNSDLGFTYYYVKTDGTAVSVYTEAMQWTDSNYRTITLGATQAVSGKLYAAVYSDFGLSSLNNAFRTQYSLPIHTYYGSVTAVDSDGNESEESDRIDFSKSSTARAKTLDKKDKS